ncbi:MAG: FixH family protein [Campylobacterales bacterium]|nr:FixH family protein [Campylobacterales bacterium]
MVFGASVMTIVQASKLPVEKSDTYMMGYQEADAKANELINARIAFDKKYKIEYISDPINTQNTNIRYRVTDINSNPVENAKIKVVITRPNKHEFDQELETATSKDGVYSFENITLPKEGRWDIMAKIDVDDLQRFYNVKVDTRNEEVKQY